MSGPLGSLPDPLWIYEHGLPYRFPLVDQQPVLRVPVAGPEPYDTLAVVRTVASVGAYAWADGDLHGLAGVVVPTPLTSRAAAVLAPPRHSSTAVLRMLQISAQWDDSGPIPLDDDNTSFTMAVDAVRAESHFDDFWRWCLTVDTAWQGWQVYAACTVEITSWVLLQERGAPPEERIDPWTIVDGSDLVLFPSPTVVHEPPFTAAPRPDLTRRPKRTRRASD